MKLPTLYRKTSTGAIQFWTIEVLAYLPTREEPGEPPMAQMMTTYGQLGTDSPQLTADIIKKGKNDGKKNATTPFQQADAEARARHEKQLKKGYVASVEAAQAEEVDALVEGGILPMLAHKFADQAHKIKFPAYVQPKLDGIRCISILKDGKCTLWSRTRKQITSMPHIVAAIEKLKVDIVFDGELYNHTHKANFEHIVSLVRQEVPGPRHTDVQYHIYDIATQDTFEKRSAKLRYLKESWLDGPIVKVETCQVQDEAQVIDYFNQWRSGGYEGAMIRNASGLYANKRSYDLQKIKEFDDDEFEIIGIDEGRGKLAGHVGAFICRTKDGKKFHAKMSGETVRLKEYFENHELWTGKRLTVKFQGLTGSEKVPRFPVGIRIRSPE